MPSRCFEAAPWPEGTCGTQNNPERGVKGALSLVSETKNGVLEGAKAGRSLPRTIAPRRTGCARARALG